MSKKNLNKNLYLKNFEILLYYIINKNKNVNN